MHLGLEVDPTLWRFRRQLQHADPPAAHHIALQTSSRPVGPRIKQVWPSDFDVPGWRFVAKVIDFVLAGQRPAMHWWLDDVALGITQAAWIMLENRWRGKAVVRLELAGPIVTNRLKA